MAFLTEIKQKLAKSVGDIYGFSVLISENGGAVIEGIKSVISIEKDEIKFRAGKKTLIVRGKDIALSDVNTDEVFIIGTVTAVEIEN